MGEFVLAEELRRRLSECPVGGVWRHRRSGRVYAVRGRAVHEATLVPLVIYEGVAAVPFARPLAEFLERFATAVREALRRLSAASELVVGLDGRTLDVAMVRGILRHALDTLAAEGD